MKFTVTAGHGGTDPGNTWNGFYEAALMDELGHIVALKLRQRGHVVREDGPKGENWPLKEAIELVEGADLAIELHTNASKDTKASGVEVVSLWRDRRKAQRIAQGIAGVLEIPVRRAAGFLDAEDIRRERGFMPGYCRHGGLIVETFFQSNTEDLRKYRERTWLVADAIATAMEELTHD